MQQKPITSNISWPFKIDLWNEDLLRIYIYNILLLLSDSSESLNVLLTKTLLIFTCIHKLNRYKLLENIHWFEMYRWPKSKNAYPTQIAML